MTPQPQTTMTPQPESTALAAQPTPITARREPTNTSAMLSLVMEATLDNESKQRYAKQLIDAEMQRFVFAQDLATAQQFALSGFFDDISKQGDVSQQTAAAMTKIRMGRSWGISEADSMRYVYFNNGRPCVETEPIAVKLREAGYDWDIRWHEDKDKRCIGCTLLPKLNGQPITETVIGEDGKETQRRCEVSFTKRDADTALYWEKGKQQKLSDKWNYQSWPRDMYYSRCISRLKRYYANSVMSGAMTKDETEDFPSVEIQKALPAPKEKLEVVEPITSGRQSRRRAGAEEIPGTAKAEPATPETKAPPTETKPVEAEKPAASEPARATETATPWPDQAAMIAAFRAENVRLGAARFQAELRTFEKTYPKYMFGRASFSDPVAAVFYRQLVAVVVDPAPPVADGVKKLFG